MITVQPSIILKDCNGFWRASIENCPHKTVTDRDPTRAVGKLHTRYQEVFGTLRYENKNTQEVGRDDTTN